MVYDNNKGRTSSSLPNVIPKGHLLSAGCWAKDIN